MKSICKIIMAAAVVLSASCSDNKADYVRLSGNLFTFSGDGYEEFLVTVDASGPWSAIYNSSWLEVQQPDGNTLKFIAAESKSNQERATVVTVVSGYAEEVIEIRQMGTEVLFNTLEMNSSEYRMSPGGIFIGGVEVELTEGVYTYTPFLIETRTGNKKYLPVLNDLYSVGAVADDGTISFSPLSGSSIYYDAQGQLRTVNVPSGYNYAIINSMSADGRIWVGFARSSKLYEPVKWVDGIPEVLSSPMIDGKGKAVLTGSMARGCSGDGSVIYGSLWDDLSAIYWKDGGSWQWLGGTEVHNIQSLNGDLYLDAPIIMADHTNNSYNGRYIAATYQGYNFIGGAEEVYLYPCYLDTQTNHLTILRDIPGGSMKAWGMTVSDDGDFVFIITRGTSFLGYVHDIKTGVTMTNEQFLTKEYGFKMRHEEAYVHHFSKAGGTIFGGTYILEGTNMQYWYMTANRRTTTY